LPLTRALFVCSLFFCCLQGEAQCNTPDMRTNGLDASGTVIGVLTDGSLGGANWTDVWSSFVSPPSGVIVVQDVLGAVALNSTAYEPKGYLPRPCLVPNMGMGDSCGWPLGFNTSDLDWNALWNSSIYDSVLPGLPPSGPPSSCFEQTCEGFAPCLPNSSTIPMPTPCSS
jgi:hypothetical protein